MPSARAISWAKFRVAVVTVSSLAILSVLLYLLTGGTLFRPKANLRVYVADATGLVRDNPVRLHGIDVGKIKLVRLSGSSNPNRIVEVLLEVDESILAQIPRDSVAATSADNMLGDKFIEITKGRSPLTVTRDFELRFQPPQDLTQNIDMTQMETQLRAIDQLLGDMEEGRNAFGLFLNSDELYRTTVARITGLEHDLRAAAAATGTLGQLLYSDTQHRQASAYLHQIDDQLAELQNSALMKDSSGYDQAVGQIRQVRQSLEQVKASPFMTSDAAYRQFTRNLRDMIRSVDDFNAGQGSGRLLTDSQPYEALDGSLKQWQSEIHEFRTNPRKFLYVRFHLF